MTTTATMRLNAAQIAALYALRGTVNRAGDLELEQPDDGSEVLVRHPDGREWAIAGGGATVKLELVA